VAFLARAASCRNLQRSSRHAASGDLRFADRISSGRSLSVTNSRFHSAASDSTNRASSSDSARARRVIQVRDNDIESEFAAERAQNVKQRNRVRAPETPTITPPASGEKPATLVNVENFYF